MSDELIETPELPETLDAVLEIDVAYGLELKDGSVYEMSGMDVLAVWTKYGRDNWDRWVAAARDRIAEWYHDDRVPARWSTRPVEPGETMADIVAGPDGDGGALYYGDLRAVKMQLALASMADEDDEPVRVIALTGDGEREFPDPDDVLGGDAGD